MTKTKEKNTRKQEAEERLKRLLKAGDTVYTVLRSRSTSGMSRRIDLYTIQNNRPVYLTVSVADFLGMPYSRADWSASKGLRVNGCGMDMGFHIVNILSTALFCPNGKYTQEGAYSLKQEWI